MSAQTNAAFGQMLNNLILKWQNRERELHAWLNGTVDGGPSNDGRYPITAYAGTEQLVTCPAKMSQMVNDLTSGAAAHASNAQAALTLATTAATNAQNALASLLNGFPRITTSYASPIGGSQGDIWLKLTPSTFTGDGWLEAKVFVKP